MPPHSRALLIGMFGPALQAIGVAWDLLDHVVLDTDQSHLTIRHILTGGPHLVIFVGLLISIICIPLALEVALAKPEELRTPFSEPEVEPKQKLLHRQGPIQGWDTMD